MRIKNLNKDATNELMILRSATKLKKKLAKYIDDAVDDFFKDEPEGETMNVKTLSTDDEVIMFRPDTLYALFRALNRGTRDAFVQAGYQAGILYGVGIIKWFVEQSRDVLMEDEEYDVGLPENSYLLVDSCIKIDRASHWGKIELDKLTKEMEWGADIIISDDFLGLEGSNTLLENRADSPDEKFLRLPEARSLFWKAYLEGTFSSAQIAWYGVKKCDPDAREVPLRAAHCEQVQLVECKEVSDNSSEALKFRLEVYNAPDADIGIYSSLCHQLLTPYIFDNGISRARVPIEHFIREMANLRKSDSVPMKRALRWLKKNLVDKEAIHAAELLESAYNHSNAEVHVHMEDEEAEREMKANIRLVTPAIILACKHIKLCPNKRVEFRNALINSGTKNDSKEKLPPSEAK